MTLSRWMRTFDIASKVEGWSLFRQDDGTTAIQKLDDPEMVAWEIEKATGKRVACRRWKRDADARGHVARRAKAGSVMHRTARRLCRD